MASGSLWKKKNISAMSNSNALDPAMGGFQFAQQRPTRTKLLL
jgi:hypothetical protein